MFRDLPKEGQQTIIEAVTGREVSAGEALMRQGDMADSLFIIAKGDQKRDALSKEAN